MHPQLIRVALRALAATGAARWLPDAPDAAGMVATLHHVEPPRLTPFAPNAHLSITPAFLEAFILHFKARGWRFVPLSEVVAAEGGDRRRIAVTLDDGFRDNSRHALPIFQRHSVPFTIFVCPGFSDAATELWWEALERIVAGTSSLSLAGDGPAQELNTRSLEEKRHAYRLWGDWLTTEADEVRQRQVVRALAERYGLDLAAFAREQIMTWEEIRAIAADPLCTIGAHTMTHPALARLSQQDAFREMQASADRIASELGSRPTSIAFPYGYAAAAGPREFSLAEQAGFAASFTTRPGYVPSAGSRQGLPRVSVNGLHQEARFFDVLFQPGLWKLRDRVRKGS